MMSSRIAGMQRLYWFLQAYVTIRDYVMSSRITGMQRLYWFLQAYVTIDVFSKVPSRSPTPGADHFSEMNRGSQTAFRVSLQWFRVSSPHLGPRKSSSWPPEPQLPVMFFIVFEALEVPWVPPEHSKYNDMIVFFIVFEALEAPWVPRDHCK